MTWHILDTGPHTVSHHQNFVVSCFNVSACLILHNPPRTHPPHSLSISLSLPLPSHNNSIYCVCLSTVPSTPISLSLLSSPPPHLHAHAKKLFLQTFSLWLSPLRPEISLSFSLCVIERKKKPNLSEKVEALLSSECKDVEKAEDSV